MDTQSDSKNTNKITGGVTGKGFDVLGQPTPEAKKKGWARRTAAQEFMNLVVEYQDLTLADFDKVVEERRKAGTFTILHEMVYKYVKGSMSKTTYLFDWLDRHVSKAPQDITLDNKGKPISSVVVKIVKTDDTQPNTTGGDPGNSVDSSSGEDMAGGEQGQEDNPPSGGEQV